MAETEKEKFRKKLAGVTDPSVLLDTGIPVLKRRLRLAQESYDKEAKDVENMLQNQSYLTALDQKEQAKKVMSLASWRLQETRRRLDELGSQVEEDDGNGVFSTGP